MMLEGALGWRSLSIPLSSASTDDIRRFRLDLLVGPPASVDTLRSVSLSFRGDVGGFAIGNSSNFTWQMVPGVEWRFAQDRSATLAYQEIGFDRGRVDHTVLCGVDFGLGHRFCEKGWKTSSGECSSDEVDLEASRLRGPVSGA